MRKEKPAQARVVHDRGPDAELILKGKPVQKKEEVELAGGGLVPEQP